MDGWIDLFYVVQFVQALIKAERKVKGLIRKFLLFSAEKGEEFGGKLNLPLLNFTLSQRSTKLLYIRR